MTTAHTKTTAGRGAASGALLAQEPAVGWRAGAAVSDGAKALMGGRRALAHWPKSRAEIHVALVRGLPCSALLSLVDQLADLPIDDLAAMLGLSSRTLRRHRDHPDKLLPPDLASKTWQLAEVLAQAVLVMGDAASAQRWLLQPAQGLDGARPVDLLRTLQGTELVTEFLGRLEHGVYN